MDVVTPAVLLRKRANKFADADPILSDLQLDQKITQEQNSTEDEYRDRKTYKKREVKDENKKTELR